MVQVEMDMEKQDLVVAPEEEELNLDLEKDAAGLLDGHGNSHTDDVVADEDEEEKPPPCPLFIRDEKEMFIQVARCAPTRFDTCLLQSEASLNEYLDNDTDTTNSGTNSPNTSSSPANNDHNTTPAALALGSGSGRFFLIDPTYGWGRLQLTSQAMSAIISRYSIFPAFSKYLRVFGQKTFAKDEGFGGHEVLTHYDHYAMNSQQVAKISSFESCFLWKYVEPGGTEGRYAYSIRQMLVYQRFDVRSKRGTNVIVRIPKKLAVEMKCALTATTSEEGEKNPLLDSWTGVQMLCARSGLDEWRDFINYLDHEVTKIFDDLIISGVNATTHGKADELQYRLTSVKQLQFFLNQIIRARNMLDINSTTITAMLRSFTRRKEYVPNLQMLQEELEDIQQEYDFLQKMSKSVLDRADMLSHELRDTIALRNHDINKEANDSATAGTQAIVELSRKSAYEARVVKLLSVVAVIFLPASFAADFLQMGYVFVTEERRFEIHATANLWLFAIFAFPLLIVTVSIYIAFELLSRRKAKKKAFLTHKTKSAEV